MTSAVFGKFLTAVLTPVFIVICTMLALGYIVETFAAILAEMLVVIYILFAHTVRAIGV